VAENGLDEWDLITNKRKKKLIGRNHVRIARGSRATYLAGIRRNAAEA
jgi:hypothetical protein